MQSPWFETNTPQLSFFSLFITTVQELSTEALLRQNCCCNMPDFYIQSCATQTLPDLVRARDPWAHEHCSGWVWSSAPLSSLAGQRRAAVGVSDYDKQQWFSRLIRTLIHLVKTFTQFLTIHMNLRFPILIPRTASNQQEPKFQSAHWSVGRRGTESLRFIHCSLQIPNILYF